MEMPQGLMGELVLAARAVVESADTTGCSDDLTVVSYRAMERLEEALANLSSWATETLRADAATVAGPAWWVQLQPGDQVYWHDPDEGHCSGPGRIVEIRTESGCVSDPYDVIVVADADRDDGTTWEVYASELS